MYQNYNYIENRNTHIWLGHVGTGGFPATVSSQWRVPSSARFLLITAIGAGSSGGGGGASTTATAAGGGSGGCGGVISSVLISTMLIPSILFIRPGEGRVGGDGQTQGGSANNGSIAVMSPSLIAITRNFAANDTILSAAGGGNGGNGGNGATAGSAPTAATLPAGSSWPLSTLGLRSVITGSRGSAGGSGAVGADLTPFSVGVICGGAGGGGVDASNNTFAGGNILAGGDIFPQVNGGTTLGGAGRKGWDFFGLGSMDLPLFGTGGSGGGGNTTSPGGRGGDGGIGGGGGGGGATNGVGSVGGVGGSGGPGAIIIVCI